MVKKLLFGVSAIILLAAGCNSKTLTTPKVSGPEGVYTLLQTEGGRVIAVVTGKKGETVWLLQNPLFVGRALNAVPAAPASPVWQNVPDGSYRTLPGQTYVVADGKIKQVLDRNGKDVTQN